MPLLLQNSSSLFLQESGAEKSYVTELVCRIPVFEVGYDIFVPEISSTSAKGEGSLKSEQPNSFTAGTTTLNTKTFQNTSARVMQYIRRTIVNVNL